MYKVGKGEAEVVSMLNEDRQLAKEVDGMVRVLISSMNKAAPTGPFITFDDTENPAASESSPPDVPHEASCPEDGGDVPSDDREDLFVPIDNP